MKKKNQTERNRPPAFQIYPKDILAHVGFEMSNAAFGCYMKLLFYAWDSNPVATIPKDQTIRTDSDLISAYH